MPSSPPSSRTLLPALVIVLLQVTLACTPPPPRHVIIRAGRLIDGSGAAAQTYMRVTVADGNIVRVESDASALPEICEATCGGARETPAADAEPEDFVCACDEETAVLDYRSLTVMPGLVDSHVHLGSSGSCTPGAGSGVGQIRLNLHASIAAGVTTIADLGGPITLLSTVRRWVGTGRSRGPRILAAGGMLTAVGGYLTDVHDGQLVDVGMVVPVSTTAEARRQVRALVAGGADFIKVGLQDISYKQQSIPMFSQEMLCAIVDEARMQERRVLAHATTPKGFELGLSCDVDGFSHCGFEDLDPSMIDRLAESGKGINPTLFVTDVLMWAPEHPEFLERDAAKRALSNDARADLDEYLRLFRNSKDRLPDFGIAANLPHALVRQGAAASLHNTRRLLEKNAAVNFGTDAGICFNHFGTPVEELRLLTEAGATELEALRIGSWGGARQLDLHDALGLVRPGYRADLAIIAGQPDTTIEDVSNVRAVMIDGVSQSLSEPGVIGTVALAIKVIWAMLLE